MVEAGLFFGLGTVLLNAKHGCCRNMRFVRGHSGTWQQNKKMV